MTLILVSGRPGVGKSEFGSWLVRNRGWIYVDSDASWNEWGNRLCVHTLPEAVATRNHAQQLGPDVVVEWGFKVELLDSVRLLRTAGFDAWWLDGDEEAARAGYIRRRGSSSPTIEAYRVQVAAIDGAQESIHEFYGDHVIETVQPGPTYMARGEIAARILNSTP